MRRRRVIIGIGALVGLQGALVLGYRALRPSRRARPFVTQPLGWTTPPPLVTESIGGARVALPVGRPTLVHFWGTWCPPCRTELPGLLTVARSLRDRHGLALLAVSVDDPWPALRDFFAGDVPPEVVRSIEPGAERRWGADALPDTYLIDAAGRLRERYAGARDWTSPSARAHLEATLPNLVASAPLTVETSP